MASILTSANNAATSTLALVEQTAQGLGKVVTTAMRGIDMLDQKTAVLHAAVVFDCIVESSANEDAQLHEAIHRHVDRREAAHKALFPNVIFDRISCAESSETLFRSAIAKARGLST